MKLKLKNILKTKTKT